ncbi:MAG: lamin tail domain-containing protein [Deltaproteobacteria bacterium]|nr:lamin tail domain-containing protein [Deltaproteobacteria bacterium]
MAWTWRSLTSPLLRGSACLAFACSGESLVELDSDIAQTVYRSGAVADGTIEVVFTEPGTTTVPAADAKLIEAIDGASLAIDVASYMFTRDPVADALVRAKNRGVSVRFVGDADESTASGYQTLLAAGIPMKLRPAGDYIMHDKFVVVDHSIVFAGSMNLTDNGAQRNNENFARISSPGLAAAYSAEFEQLFSGKFGPAKSVVTQERAHTVGATRAEVYFSPKDDMVAKVRAELMSAQSTVRFMIYEFGNLAIANELVATHQRGVEVVGLFDAGKSGGTSSRDEVVVAAGIPTFLDGNEAKAGWSGGDLHHKVMIIDEAGPNPVVLTGSFNWTTTAATRHDENLLILRGAEIARIYGAEFCRDFAIAKPHPLSPAAPAGLCARIPAIPVINEALANPDGVDRDEEFVEIVNPSESPIDLTGYQLRDATSLRHVFGPTLLPPGSGVVVYSGGANRLKASTGQLSLNNDTDQLVLLDSRGQPVDQLTYTSPVSGVSFNRAVDGDRSSAMELHQLHSAAKSSPGRRLDGTAWAPWETPTAPPPPPPPPAGVLINEALADPAGTDLGAEYVEIVNSGTNPVDITGWTLSDATAVRHTFAAVTLAPGKALVVFDRGDHSSVPSAVNASTQLLSLNNSAETVRLRDASGGLVDEVVLPAATSGVSLNRSPDGVPGASLAPHNRVSSAPQSPGLRATLEPW